MEEYVNSLEEKLGPIDSLSLADIPSLVKDAMAVAKALRGSNNEQKHEAVVTVVNHFIEKHAKDEVKGILMEMVPALIKTYYFLAKNKKNIFKVAHSCCG